MASILFTGFPGFLASELLPRVLRQSADERAICLVQRRYAAQAAARAEEIERADTGLRGRIVLAEGDITRPELGLDRAPDLKQQTRAVYHLAAVYDLTVRREVGMQVNVAGTENVLRFAEECPRLGRVHYISTCYVSGRHAGVFTEDDLDRGQRFNNAYEETKFLAEIAVRERSRGGMPVTIYRPAIVVGDSRTGATQKYDGPYFLIRWLLRQPYMAVLPTMGNPALTRVNLVPRDYVVDAVAYLGGRASSVGKVYHLADPEPLTVATLVDEIARATRRRVVPIPLPRAVAKFALNHVPGVYWLMQIPAPIVDYFVHPTQYGCARTMADLAGSGLCVPPLPTYIDRLVDFVRRYPAIGSEAMR